MTTSNSPPAKKEESPAPTVGIYITKGMRVTIPAGGLQLRVADDGRLEGNATLHLLYDVCPTWLRLAFEHLLVAEAAWDDVRAAWDVAGKEEEAAQALEREFAAGMQAASASAIAIDAFHASVKTRIGLPGSLTKRWRKNGTARHRQIAEVLRRAFAMGPKSANQLRLVLNDIMRFRDQAVHPSGALAAPHFHPELGRGMEWRFVTFRFTLVKTLVSLSLSTVAQLCFCPRPKYPDLERYCVDLRPKAVELLYAFERRYGPQFERDAGHKGPPEERAAV